MSMIKSIHLIHNTKLYVYLMSRFETLNCISSIHPSSFLQTHLPQTGSLLPLAQWCVIWCPTHSSPWVPWEPRAAAGHTRFPSPPYRSSTPDWGCSGTRHSVHNAPSSPYRREPHHALGRNSAGTSRTIPASPSESPGASRAWRIPHRRRQRTAVRSEPTLCQHTSDWSPSLTPIWF